MFGHAAMHIMSTKLQALCSLHPSSISIAIFRLHLHVVRIRTLPTCRVVEQASSERIPKALHSGVQDELRTVLLIAGHDREQHLPRRPRQRVGDDLPRLLSGTSETLQPQSPDTTPGGVYTRQGDECSGLGNVHEAIPAHIALFTL